MLPDENLKESWTQPELEVFGNVETLTLANNKVLGTSDGFTFQGQPIRLSG
jgi:hypothetical protein